jgi:acetyltransferase-like isoleucine patch superfamily enzyme
MLIISEHAKVSPMADIEDSVRGTKIIIEAGVVIDSFVKIKPAGGEGDVIIGENTFINSGTVIYTGNGVRIGRDVLIAANCTIAPVNHGFWAKDRKIIEQRFGNNLSGIIIEDDVWIGANSVILDGAVVSKGCVVAAHSLVRGRLKEYGVYSGSPAVKIGQRI